MHYRNPIIPGFYPDPSVCRVGEDYYLVNSSFAYFPGVPIWHSRDLVNWKQIGYCLTRKKQLQLNKSPISGGIYAPTLRYHEGTFYMVTTNIDDGGHFYVYTRDPYGEWSDPIYVDQSGIDPSLFFDDDGKVYFTSTGGVQSEGIYQCEIDINTGAKLRDTELIWKGTGGAFPEGPHIYKTRGYYYLMCAEGGTEYGHMETIARGLSPYGPFKSCPYNPILSHRSLNSPIHATGHADIVEAQDGSWWAVFLGIRPVRFPYRHHIGRETFLAPVKWTSDDWPIIGNSGTTDIEVETQTLPTVVWEKEAEIDHFDRSLLDMKWNYIRDAGLVNWSLSKRNSWLALFGTSLKLSDEGTPAFIGCRQRHLSCEVSSKIEFDPMRGDEAGLAVYMNEQYHYVFALTRKDGNMSIIIRKQVGCMMMEQYSQLCDEITVELKIHAMPLKYIFMYRLFEEGEWIVAGEAETHFVSTELAGGFTGVFFGLYNYSISQQVAYFDWFKYYHE